MEHREDAAELEEIQISQNICRSSTLSAPRERTRSSKPAYLDNMAINYCEYCGAAIEVITRARYLEKGLTTEIEDVASK
eukprot:2704084-Pleurochrysis_carterae.AAC.1